MQARAGATVVGPALAAAVALSACGGASDGAEIDVALTDLPCSSLDSTSGIWESSPFPLTASCGDVDAGTGQCCPWMDFPGGAVLHVAHALGRTPRRVDGTIAFDAYGVGGTPGSGDAFRVLAADAVEVTVENRTDQRFHLRIALE